MCWKISKYQLAISLLIVAFSAGAATAATLQIRCPTKTVTAKIKDALPTGWWTTPQGATLKDVDIINIAGKQSLICLYQQSGRLEIGVMRHFPPGYLRCEIRRSKLDFVCTK